MYLHFKHIIPNWLNMVNLQGRLSDKNMAVKTKAIGVMSTLGKVLGSGTKKHKELMVTLVPLLADSKKMIQTQVTAVSYCAQIIVLLFRVALVALQLIEFPQYS